MLDQLKDQRTKKRKSPAAAAPSPTKKAKVVDLIKECDLNNDGVTSFQEFLYILRRFADKEQFAFLGAQQISPC